MLLEFERLKDLVCSERNLEDYYQTRRKYIERSFQDEKAIEDLLKKTIQDIFRNSIDKRIQEFKEKCKMARFEEKKEFFLKIKRIIFKYNLTETVEEK